MIALTTAEKIKLQRKLLGINQTELGDRLGVKKNAVSKWECGRVEDIPASKIKLMAKIFCVPPSYLIDDDPSDASSAEMERWSPATERSDWLRRIALFYPQLNDLGRSIAIERIEELAQNPKYQNKNH